MVKMVKKKRGKKVKLTKLCFFYLIFWTQLINGEIKQATQDPTQNPSQLCKNSSANV